MDLDDFLVDCLDERAYELPNFLFWIQTVCEAMSFIGPETDADLEGMMRQLQDHHAGIDVAAAVIDDMRHKIVRLRGNLFWGDVTPLGLKYRCLNAIAASRDSNLADLDYWQDGLVTAWQIIRNHDESHEDKDQALIQFIRQRAKERNVELYETHDVDATGDWRQVVKDTLNKES